MPKPVVIVDYGMGNLGSIQNMFMYLAVESVITGDHQKIATADKILLPGVGAFDTAMKKIRDSGLNSVLDKKALEDQIPILGICLGMQILTRSSEEGVLPGLGWVDAATHKFPALPDLKVPHMGWNDVTVTHDSRLTLDLPVDPRFYFVHSYYVRCARPETVLMTAHHGVTFDAALEQGNIFGAQFHPEKSHKFGMKILKNFAEL